MRIFRKRSKAAVHRKQPKVWLAATLCALLAVVGGILPSGAFYKNVLHAVTNLFSFQTASVTVEEPGVDPANVPWGENTKPVQVRIPADGAESVVRVTIVPVVTNSSGDIVRKLLGGLSEPVDGKIVMGDLTLVFDADWQSYWQYRDGLFYYRTVLSPGEVSHKLLSGVVLTQDTPAKRAQYTGLTVKIDVITEALQATHGAPAEWGMTVGSGGEVTFS